MLRFGRSFHKEVGPIRILQAVYLRLRLPLALFACIVPRFCELDSYKKGAVWPSVWLAAYLECFWCSRLPAATAMMVFAIADTASDGISNERGDRKP